MIITPNTLLILLTLTPCITASKTDIPDNDTPANTSEIITKRLNALHLTNSENTFIKEPKLWTKTLGNDIQAVVMTLDDKIGKMTNQTNDFNFAAALIYSSLKTSGDAVEQTVDEIVKVALELQACNLLRALQSCLLVFTSEQLARFLAQSYKSSWFDSHFWHSRQINWNNHIKAIRLSNNPLFVKDLLMGRISSTGFLNIGQDSLLDLIAEYDLDDVYRSLNFATPERLTTHLETLANSGSFQLLRAVQEFLGKNLHLEEYSHPKKLPKDIAEFKFFWTQGYCYLPTTQFLSMACEFGRDDILEFFYSLNSTVLIPDKTHIILAAKNGHSNVLEWALNHNISFCHSDISSALILNSRFEAFEQLQEKLKFSIKDAQKVSNEAAQKERLNVVKWLYSKFKIVPESDILGETSTKMLKWIKVVSPQTINTTLAAKASFSNLKWLSKRHSHLFTNDVKSSHNFMLASFKKMQWMLLNDWNANPDLLHAASVGEIEMLKFGYNSSQIKPTKEHAMCAAKHGQVKVLALIHTIDPCCINKDMLLTAVQFNQLESAKYLESVLNLKDSALNFFLLRVFDLGNLKLIRWIYEQYKLDQPAEVCLCRAIENGHLYIINWALEKGFILKTDERYLRIAAQYGRHQIFYRLLEYGVRINLPKFYTFSKAFKSGSLESVKYLMAENPENIISIEDEQITIANYHIMQWIQDQNSCLDYQECCIL